MLHYVILTADFSCRGYRAGHGRKAASFLMGQYASNDTERQIILTFSIAYRIPWWDARVKLMVKIPQEFQLIFKLQLRILEAKDKYKIVIQKDRKFI